MNHFNLTWSLARSTNQINVKIVAKIESQLVIEDEDHKNMNTTPISHAIIRQ